MKIFQKFFEKDADDMSIKEMTGELFNKCKGIINRLVGKSMSSEMFSYMDEDDLKLVKDYYDIMEDSEALSEKVAGELDKIDSIDRRMKTVDEEFGTFRGLVYDDLNDIKTDLVDIRDMVERLCERREA